MEELLSPQDGGHLRLEAALAAGDTQQVPTPLIRSKPCYSFLCVHILDSTQQNAHAVILFQQTSCSTAVGLSLCSACA